MHVLPLPFGLALALLPRRDAPLVRDNARPIRIFRGPNHRERIFRDPAAATYRRPVA